MTTKDELLKLATLGMAAGSAFFGQTLTAAPSKGCSLACYGIHKLGENSCGGTGQKEIDAAKAAFPGKDGKPGKYDKSLVVSECAGTAKGSDADGYLAYINMPIEKIENECFAKGGFLIEEDAVTKKLVVKFKLDDKKNGNCPKSPHKSK